jgi:hypothetical protein
MENKNIPIFPHLKMEAMETYGKIILKRGPLSINGIFTHFEQKKPLILRGPFWLKIKTLKNKHNTSETPC